MEPRSADFQYFQSAVSRISNPQALGSSGACRLEVGDTAGWETCATSVVRHAYGDRVPSLFLSCAQTELRLNFPPHMKNNPALYLLLTLSLFWGAASPA